MKSFESAPKIPNILEDLEHSVDMVMQVESEWSKSIEPKDRSILMENISLALETLQRKRERLSEEDLLGIKERASTGFQGIGGFNRYVVYGDGSIGLSQSHSISACVKKAQELGIKTPEFNL